mgnify:CR=1 FL=1
MIKFIILTHLFLLFILQSYTAVGQNVSGKEHIDSIVLANEKISFIQKSYANDSIKATYFINPKSNNVTKIEVETLNKSRGIWVYWYNLDNDLRVMIVSKSKIDGKVFRDAIYYFKDDKLVFKEETNAKIEKPEDQSLSVKYLLDRMPKE